MKKLRRYRTSLGGMMTALVALWQIGSPLNLSAATLYWDLNGATANTGTDATGNWDGVTTNWNTADTGTGGTPTATTTAADDLIFSSGTGYTDLAIITVSGTQQAKSITLEEGALTVSGGTINLATTGGITVNNGAGATTFSTGLTVGSAAATETFSISNNSASLLTLGTMSGSTSGDKTLTLGGTGNTTVSGIISNGSATTFNVTKTGAGTLQLDGNNSYTGITTISGGTVKLGHVSALGATGTGNQTVVASGATLDLNGLTIAEAFGAAGANGDGFTGAAAILTNSSATAASVTGTINSDGGSTFIVNGTGDISLTRVSRTNGTTGSPTITKNGNNILILEGTADNSSAAVIVNTGVVQLNKGGSGVRALGAASTIGASGTLRLTTGQTNGDQLFSGVDLTNNGIFDLQGQDESFNNMTGTGLVTNGATNNASVLTLGENNGTFTWAGVIQDGAGTSTLFLTKMGTGVMTMTNTNTYTGATQISGNGGGLTLDFVTAVGTSNLIAAASALTMNNTSASRIQTLTLTGDASQTNSQTFNGLTFGSPNRHRIVVTSGASGTSNLALGTISFGSAFVDFVLPTSGAITTTNAIGALSPSVTLNNGASYAQVNGSGQIVAFNGDLVYVTATNISALPGYTALGNLLVDNTSTGNVLQAAGTTNLSTIQVTDTTARTITIGTGNTLRLGGTGGLLRGSTAGSLIVGEFGNAGTLTTGTIAGADLILTNGNATGTLTVNAVIADNTGGALDLVVNGAAAATIILAGANTFTGTTMVQTGSLQITNGAGLGSITGGTNVVEGAALELSGGITIGDEALTIFGTGVSSNGVLRNVSGTNTYGGLVTIAASTTEIQAETGTTLIFDRTGAATTSMTTPGNITLDTVGTGVMTFLDALVSTGSSNPTITKAGNGTVNFTVANTWVGTGAFTLNDGVVRISNDNALGGTTAGTTVTNNAALELIGGINTNESITLDNAVGISTAGAIRNISGNNFISGTITVDNGTGRINSDAGTLTLSAAAALQSESGGSRTAALGGAGVISITGVARDNPTVTNRLSISKDGTGTLILSGANTYTGTTAVTAGTVMVTSSSGLGTTTTADVTVSANASLNYFAATDTALTIGGALTVTGGTNTSIGASIGSTTTSARIIVTEAATISNAAHKINLFGVSGTTPATGTYTLIAGGAGSALNPLTAPTLGTVYNNTNFTVGAFSRTATTLSVDITSAAAITNAFWTGGLTGATNVWAASNGATASNWVTSAAGGATGLVPSSAADVTISATTVVTAPTATVLGANMGIKTLTISDTANGLGLDADGFTLTITPGSASTGITMDLLVPASTIAANVALGAAQTWTNNSANTLTVNGAVSGAFALTKAGTGTLTLGGVNTYSGGTILSAGTLIASSNQALGLAANSLSLGSGTLDLASDISTTAHNTTVTGNVTIVSNRATAGTGITHTLGTLSIGANTLTIGAGLNVSGGTPTVAFGAATLTGAATFTTGSGVALLLNSTLAAGGNALTINGPGSVTVTGVYSGTVAPGTAGLTITGGATVNLASGSNTFTGDIYVDGSTFQYNGGGTTTTTAQFGRGSSTDYKQMFLTNGGTFSALTSFNVNVSSATNLAAGLIFNIGTGGGTFNVASGATLTVDDGTVAGTGFTASQLQGAGTLTKTGLGTLVLRNQNVFAGAIDVQAGLLQISGTTAFGLNTAGTTIQAGAALNLNDQDVTDTEPLTISGVGLAAAPTGVITNSAAGGASFAGPVTLAANSTIGAAAAGALTLSGGITGAFDLTIQNLAAGGTTLSSNAINNGGTITNSGTGTGATTISASIGSNVTSIIQNSATSTMTLSGANIAFTGGIIVNAGTLNITGGGTTAPTPNALSLKGGAALNLFNDVGQSFNLGSGAIDLGTGSGTATLGLDLGGAGAYDRFISSVAATTANSVVLNLTGITGFQAGNYDLITAASGLSGATYSIGSLSGLMGGFTLGLTTSDTLVRLTSTAYNGTYYWNGGVSGNPLSWSAMSGVSSNFTTDVAGTINANGIPGLNNSVVFSTSTQTATSLTTTLDGAFTIRDLTFNNQLGTGPLATININAGTGGTLTITPASATAGINVETGAPASINLGAPIILGANQTWTVTDAATVLSVTGGITGTANLTKDGSGILQLSGTNTYVGTTTVNGGILQAGAANGFNGTSAHVIGASGTLRLNNFAAAIGSLAGSGTVENGASATAIRVLTAGADNTSTIFSGVLQNGGSFGLALTKTGTGVLELSGVNTYTGNTSVAGGTLKLTGSLTGNGTTTAGSTLSIGTVAGNAIFEVSGSGSVNSYFTFLGAAVSGANAVYNQTGGTMNFTSTSTGDSVNLLSNSAGGYGYMSITGGTTNTLGRFNFSKNGTGVAYIGGTGVLNLKGEWAMVTYANANTMGAVTVGPGGTLDRSGASNRFGIFMNQANQYGVLNLAGGALTMTSQPLVFGNGNGGTNNIGFLNLAGGTFSTGSNVIQSVGTSTGQNAYINLAGATLRATATLSNAFPLTVTGQTVTVTNFGAIDNAGTAQDFTGGLTVDTNGNSVTIQSPILAAAGSGVAQSSLTINGGSGYVGAPMVQFIGGTLTAGGTPAAGYAIVSGGQVTEIVITSPGTYTVAPTVTLTGGGGTGASVTVGTLIANSSGGLTKIGTGTLTMSGANTYTGGTFINAGTLALGANDVLANAGAVTVSGATFDVATFSDTVGLVTLQSGSISGSTGVLTSTSNYELQNGTVSAILAGAVGINKTTAGNVTLSGANTFSGVVNVTAGALDFSTSGNLGNASATNTITLGGGTLRYTAAGALNLTANRVVTLTSGTTNTVEVTQTTGNLQVSGGFSTSAAANLVKDGPGSLTVIGALNLTGGNLTVSDGAYIGGLAATGISGLNVGATGSLQLVDSAAVGATLTALTLNSGARLGFELGAPGTNDSLTLSGAATLTGGTITLDFYNLGGLATGNYNLISAGSGLLGGGAIYVLGTAPVGFNYVINQTDTLISVGVSILSNRYWTNSQTTGSWNTLTGGTLSNFSTDLAGTINSAAIPTSVDTVIFSATSVVTSPVNTTLDAVLTIDSLVFNANPAGGTFTIDPGTGGTLTLAPVSTTNGISVGNNGGAVTISAPLTAGAVGGAVSQTWLVDGTGISSLSITGNITFIDRVNKTGGGLLTLSGNNGGAGGLTLVGGTLNIGSATALGTGTFTVGAGTTFTNSTAGSLTLTTNNAQSWNGSFTFGGTQSLNMGIGAVTLGNDVTTTVSNTLTIGGVIDDGINSYSLTKAGAGTLVLNGNNAFSGGLTLSAGGLNLGHASALGTGLFTINGGTLDNSSGGALTLSTNNTQSWNSSFTFTGTNSLDVGTGAVTLGVTPTLTVTANTLTVGGSISGAFGITKTGSGTLTLTGLSATASSNYLGTTTLNSGTTNINTAASFTGGLTFGSTAGNTTSSTLNLPNGATFAGALLVQTNNATANTITLGSGQTLTLNGNVQIGSTTPLAANSLAKLTIGGGGHLNVATAAGGLFQVGGSTNAAPPSQNSILDLTGLSTATINVTATGTVRVNQPNGNNVAGNQASLLLPTPVVVLGTAVTTITAGSFNIGDNGSNGNGAGQTNSVIMGTGLTTLNVNTVNIGTGGRDFGELVFAAGNGTIKLRAADGSGRAAFNLGTGSANTGVAPGTGVTNKVDLTGHSADLLISTLTIGGQNRNTARTDAFTFDTGTLDATTVVVGTNTGTAAGTVSSTWTSTLNLDGGTTTIGAGGLDIAFGATAVTGTDVISGNVNISGGTTTIANNATFGAAVRMSNNTIATGLTANSTLNITGGSLTLAGNLIKGATTGTGTATVTLNGATAAGAVLDMGGGGVTHSIGGAAANVVTFNLQQGTLLNLSEFNGGAGLVKTTAGTVILENTGILTNTYTGGTTISGGILQVGSGSSTGTLGSGNVTNNATLTFNRNNSYTVNQNIVTSTNSGKVIQAGSGTTILGGSNTYEGGTDINNGVLQVNSASALGTVGTIDFGGGTLQYTSNNTSDYSGRIANSTSAIKIDTNGQSVTYGTALANTNTGGLTKEGAGTLILTTANSYTGATTVNAGTLQVGTVATAATAATGAGAVTVNAGGTLAGTGTVNGTTTIQGTVMNPGVTQSVSLGVLRPGDPNAGTTNAQFNVNGDLTVAAAGRLELEITTATYQDTAFTTSGLTALAYLTANGGQVALWDADPILGNNDFINVNGSLSLATRQDPNQTPTPGFGTVGVISNGYNAPQLGDIFNLIDWTGSFSGGFNAGSGNSSGGTFGDFDLASLSGGLAWDTSAFTTYGVIAVVPEPSRMLLLMFGLMALFFRRRRLSVLGF